MAAKEAFQEDADIVLLQEVVSRQQFSEAAQEFGYELGSWSTDDAVYVRPSESVAFLGNAISRRDFASCLIRFEQTSCRVISLRLSPPVFRLDWWNPDCWREYSRDAERRRRRIAEIRQEAGAIGGRTDELIGGDFNTTSPGSMSDLNDVGRHVGRGWMGTGTNDFPLARVDQLSSSAGLIWQQAYVAKTENSDHRMLIADFSLNR